MRKTDIRTLIGKKFGLFTVMHESETIAQQICVHVRCDCGVEKDIAFFRIKSGNTKSCGCHRDRVNKTKSIVHGLRSHPLFRVWCGMKSRCNNKNTPSYKRYGGRGIKVCTEWNIEFLEFYKWGVDKYRKGLQIDRINNGGNYEPTNCRFISPRANSNNKDNNKVIVFNNEKMTVSESERKYNLPSGCVYRRLKLGWSVEDALLTPPKIQIRSRKI